MTEFLLSYFWALRLGRDPAKKRGVRGRGRGFSATSGSAGRNRDTLLSLL